MTVKDSRELFDKRCRKWFVELEANIFDMDGSEMDLDTYLNCMAFDARFDPQRAKAFKMAADAVSFLARIMDERRAS